MKYLQMYNVFWKGNHPNADRGSFCIWLMRLVVVMVRGVLFNVKHLNVLQN